jgi:glycosyltransferase involved in cell wall biosynthesis
MYRGSRVAVVMPAYDVQAHIGAAVIGVPRFVDFVVVVDDGSRDETATVVRRLPRVEPELVLVQHQQNFGVGAAIATGYEEALRRGAGVVAVMAGDGQMDPADLPRLLDPVVEGRVDYAKGNRFRYPGVWRTMPTTRLVGNIVLSLLTKLSSGYLRLFDSQCGYTVASRATVERLGRFFSRYGYPNDVLARLRVLGARVVDVPVRPIYDGQSSGIRLWTVLYPMLFVLLASMVRRLWAQIPGVARDTECGATVALGPRRGVAQDAASAGPR